MTDLEIAREEHRQAERGVRRLAEEYQDARGGGVYRRLCKAQARLEAAVARLAQREGQATRPDDAENRHTNQPESPNSRNHT